MGASQQPQHPHPGFGHPAGYPPSSFRPPYASPGNHAQQHPGYPQPVYGQPWPGHPDRGPQRRSRLLIALAITVPLLLILCGVGGWMWFSRTGDEEAIKVVAARFADAIDTQDQDKLLATLCEEERDDLVDGAGLEPDELEPGAPDDGEPFDVTNVTVKGDLAELQFLRPASHHSGSLYLRKEDGMWKMCSPAEEDFPQ